MATGNPKHHVNVEGRQRATDAESITTDDATYNNSVTYPDGTTVTASPGEGLWTEDGNSPIGPSATAASHTITLNGEWDLLYVAVTEVDSPNNNNLELQVDGATSGYNELRTGSTGTSLSEVTLATSISNCPPGQILISGRGFQNRAGIYPQIGNIANEVVKGEAVNVTSPIDSMTLSDGASADFTLTAEVYGYDGA